MRNNAEVAKKFDPNQALQKPICKILGIYWDMQKDLLYLCLKISETSIHMKRSFLRAMSSYFDPFGWFAPAYLPSMNFVEKLWMEKYNWDKPIPVEFKSCATAQLKDLQ